MKKTIPIFIFLILTLMLTTLPSVTYAQPYGAGYYDSVVPYGGQTSLSIATSGNVSIPITPTSSGVLATGTSTVTVTSTDVVGYNLYLQALSSTSMTNGAASLPASSNVSEAPLSVDTWGYNTDSSSNFVGPTTSNVLIKAVNGPVETGDVTTFTYGIKIDLAKPAGKYSSTIVYTAVPQTT